MIDGIKISVPPSVAGCWLGSPLLDFYTQTNTQTGEILDGAQVAKYKGLTFIITSSKKYEGRTYCTVRGSLHKYFYNGDTNAPDFDFKKLCWVINDLKERFDIAPELAALHSLEFGVNIQTDLTASAIIKNLVANGNRPFQDFKVNRQRLGVGIGKDEYKVKIYDKGKQENKPVKNLLRLEFAVKRMRYLKPFAIATLADLLELDKVKPLGGLLVDFWNASIYYDKKVKYKDMSNFERKKVLYYATPRNWADFTAIQRMRAKKHFAQLMAKYCTSSDQQKTTLLIAQKWNDLAANKCISIHKEFKRSESTKMYINSQLECTGKTYTNTFPNETIKKGRKSTEKKPLKNVASTTLKTHQETQNKKGRKCRVCSTDISQKKKEAVYCSKRCNNSYQAMKRKEKRHALKKSERRTLGGWLLNLDKLDLWLLIEYGKAGAVEAITLHQSEIATGWEWARTVKRITRLDNGRTLTGIRAKTFINKQSKYNLNTKNKTV